MAAQKQLKNSAHSIVEAHGGKIEAQNNPDEKVLHFHLLFQNSLPIIRD
jgi:signal transduction histidine kinase